MAPDEHTADHADTVRPGGRAAAEAVHLRRLLAAEPPAGDRFAYGPLPDQFVEVFGDPATARRTIVFVHGGYFRETNGLGHARPLARALSESEGAGALVVLVEYRRAGGEGGHPRTLDDITAAIAFALGPLAPWGASGRTRREPVIAGHSAGGCLVLAWASHQPEDGPGLRICALAPITDLIGEVRKGLGDGAVLDYLGVRPEDDVRPYLWEDPRSRAALIPARMDVRLLHGTADATVDVEFSRQFPAPRRELPGGDHFDVIDPASAHFPVVSAALLG